MIKIIKVYAFMLGLVILTNPSYSQDLKAGEIKIHNLSGLTYQATVDVYYESSTFLFRPFILLDWGDGSPLDTFFNSAGSLAPCDFSTTAKRYVGIHTYLNYGNYNISSIDSFRVVDINNISNSLIEKMVLLYQLNLDPSMGSNSSPVIIYCLINEWQCCNWLYNPSAYDADGDSLSYCLVPPITTNYTMPSSSIDSVTGIMTFSPTAVGLYSFCMKISEWRAVSQSQYLIGNSYHEILIKVNSLVSVHKNTYENHISFFPNPVTSIINISDEQNELQNSTITITDNLGQSVFSSPFTSQIDLSGLSAGMYFLSIDDRGDRKVVKIIKHD